MIDSYWDLYVAYMDYCVRYNFENDIDPHHYKMEWNHYLPQCIFGDQPVGQYLSLKQHAIASALQTLAFNKNCMCGWHKKYLPDRLLTLAWGLFIDSQRQIMTPNAKRYNAIANNPEVNAIRSRSCRERNLAKTREEILRIAAKIAEKNRGRKNPSMAGDNNPSRRTEVREKIRQARLRQTNVSTNHFRIKYMCTVTGFISTAAGLKKYQKNRGIDTSNRIQLE